MADNSGNFLDSWGTIKLMLLEFFTWWYGRGWQEIIKDSLAMLDRVQLSFSIPVLLRTLFSPWKQIVDMPGKSIDQKFQVLLDNLISRTVGFFVRIFALVAAAILLVVTAVVGIIMTIAWPVIPLLIIYCAFRGIIG